MLKLKPNCECCDKDLAPDSVEAIICSFECTFCRDCAANVFNDVCPNCGGNFSARPIRPVEALKQHPASKERVTRQDVRCA